MPYGDRFTTPIFDAQAGVAKAMEAYSKGGSVDAVDRAKTKLSLAHARLDEFIDGRVPDHRGE
jgi:alpha-D-ribose 1-methylphosphonate 5-triphosphate synthase subunit PhnH